ncbi:LexA/Signal peptidase [Pleomassaria siparia CBS 279.74]|uniref:Mitochondrial inner membrane protease subunit n=1 Tax=Pleomassaria siparia CBS 279.74 TaxID=1314801 RepID=A0A6G1KCM0_9PLEO|nr:LexA/Signal peptidase [Pleomassaria siparia CBS 279.74]
MPPPRTPLASLLRTLRARSKPSLDSTLLKTTAVLKWSFGWAIVGHIFFGYIGSVRPTEGVSMVPTIPSNFRSQPWIVTSKLHRRGRGIRVGDMVAFNHPMMAGSVGAKRVIGMPGDFVSVYTPGKKDEDLQDLNISGGEVREEVFRVPEGHCWVAGDNLEWSRDSRIFGPLPLALVTGKIVAIVKPWSHTGWVKNSLVEPSEEEPEWKTGK